jgi:hypothetical protein
VQFERRYYWRGFVPESIGNIRFFGIKLGNVKSVTTDGGKNMRGSKTGVLGRICKKCCKLALKLRWYFTASFTNRHNVAKCY